MVIKFYIPINDSFLEEVDERNKHTSLYLEDKPGAESPVLLDKKTLAFINQRNSSEHAEDSSIARELVQERCSSDQDLKAKTQGDDGQTTESAKQPE